MSQENVEVVASVYEAFARRDNAAPFAAYAADIEWDMSRGLAEGLGGVYHGHDGVRQFFGDLLAAFSVIDFTVEDLTEAGDRVIATVHERYVGRMSGVEVDRIHYVVFTFQDGKVTRLCAYLDPAEALEAAGLSE
jgi:ketosteroid isomerase-like protein